MSEMEIFSSACIVTGGEELRRRVENTMMFYAPEGGYFDLILEREGAAFAESACGFLLLDSLLLCRGIDRAGLVLERTPAGRPFVANRGDIDFSISHSEGCAFCALALGEGAGVGADIQRDRGYSEEKLSELSKAFMTEAEYAQFLAAADKTSFFYRTWTANEAAQKRAGASIFGGNSDRPDGGELYASGIITACGKRYFYSIDRAAECCSESEIK